jgi:hypothetical protein
VLNNFRIQWTLTLTENNSKDVETTEGEENTG